jgi:hypothetical protein
MQGVFLPEVPRAIVESMTVPEPGLDVVLAQVQSLRREVDRLRREGRARRRVGYFGVAAMLLLVPPSTGRAVEIPTDDIAAMQPIDAASMVDRFSTIGAAITTLEERVTVGYRSTSGQVIPPETAYVDYSEEIHDPLSAVETGANWEFVVPQAGAYLVHASIGYGEGNAVQVVADVEVDGERALRGIGKSDYLNGEQTTAIAAGLLYLEAGASVQVRAHHNNGAPLALSTNPQSVFYAVQVAE